MDGGFGLVGLRQGPRDVRQVLAFRKKTKEGSMTEYQWTKKEPHKRYVAGMLLTMNIDISTMQGYRIFDCCSSNSWLQ